LNQTIEKIKAELGHNLVLVLDVKTRRNSLADMISMFLKLFKFIKEASLEINCSYMFDFIDFEVRKDLNRNDTTLLSSSFTLESMQKKIAD
jgi:hypothetical protein